MLRFAYFVDLFELWRNIPRGVWKSSVNFNNLFGIIEHNVAYCQSVWNLLWQQEDASHHFDKHLHNKLGNTLSIMPQTLYTNWQVNILMKKNVTLTYQRMSKWWALYSKTSSVPQSTLRGISWFVCQISCHTPLWLHLNNSELQYVPETTKHTAMLARKVMYIK